MTGLFCLYYSYSVWKYVYFKYVSINKRLIFLLCQMYLSLYMSLLVVTCCSSDGTCRQHVVGCLLSLLSNILVRRSLKVDWMQTCSTAETQETRMCFINSTLCSSVSHCIFWDLGMNKRPKNKKTCQYLLEEVDQQAALLHCSGLTSWVVKSSQWRMMQFYSLFIMWCACRGLTECGANITRGSLQTDNVSVEILGLWETTMTAPSIICATCFLTVWPPGIFNIHTKKEYAELCGP